jgi:hypothetical protein
MSDLIDQEEEHKAEIEVKHFSAQNLDVMKLAGVKEDKPILSSRLDTLTE